MNGHYPHEACGFHRSTCGHVDLEATANVPLNPLLCPFPPLWPQLPVSCVVRSKLLSQDLPRNEGTAGSEDAKFPQTVYGLNLKDLGLHLEGIHRNFQKIISAKGHRQIWEPHETNTKQKGQ